MRASVCCALGPTGPTGPVDRSVRACVCERHLHCSSMVTANVVRAPEIRAGASHEDVVPWTTGFHAHPEYAIEMGMHTHTHTHAARSSQTSQTNQPQTHTLTHTRHHHQKPQQQQQRVCVVASTCACLSSHACNLTRSRTLRKWFKAGRAM